MVSLFLLMGSNLSYIVGLFAALFAALHELASASAHTLLKLASLVRALLKPYGDTLRVLLASNTVAMVTYCVTKMVPTCSPMVGQFFDTMIVASSDKERS